MHAYKNTAMTNSEYLQSTFFIDAAHPDVRAFAEKHTQEAHTPRAQAVALYYAVRDGFLYNPYKIDLRKKALKASALLARNSGYCVEKANLLAAAGRALGIPTRLGFGIVQNHIGTSRLEEFLGTKKLVFHGYTEFFLEGQWVKATPAFNRELCTKLGVAPLEFDGKNDSLFQAYSEAGGAFMEYLHEYGTFADLPRDLFIAELKKHYGKVFKGENFKNDFFEFRVAD